MQGICSQPRPQTSHSHTHKSATATPTATGGKTADAPGRNGGRLHSRPRLARVSLCGLEAPGRGWLEGTQAEPRLYPVPLLCPGRPCLLGNVSCNPHSFRQNCCLIPISPLNKSRIRKKGPAQLRGPQAWGLAPPAVPSSPPALGEGNRRRGPPPDKPFLNLRELCAA